MEAMQAKGKSAMKAMKEMKALHAMKAMKAMKYMEPWDKNEGNKRWGENWKHVDVRGYGAIQIQAYVNLTEKKKEVTIVPWFPQYKNKA